MYYFCTYFDHGYLPRGLALYWSLRQHCRAFQLWVLCMDRACYETLSQMRLANVHLITLEEFEESDEQLQRAKKGRTLVEYYFTCTPSLPLFILDRYIAVDRITYLDADLFFFSDPAQIYDEIASSSVAIIAHRYAPKLRWLEKFGIYNVGWLSFRRDANALACLRWWRERCLEWCYDRCEDGRFADQKYLDEWPSLFDNVLVLDHKGANLGPYNLGNYKVGRKVDRIWVDEQPLVFFHFHALKQITGWLYDSHLANYAVRPSRAVRKGIYGPYIRALLNATKGEGINTKRSSEDVAAIRRLLRLCRAVLMRSYIFVIDGCVVQ